jgi:hypothetical protein
MNRPIPMASRRSAMHCAAALVLSTTALAWAQPARPAAARNPGKPGDTRTVTIAQIVDVSPEQQDVSKDFLIGSRAAWQDINTRGGIKGRPVQHQSIEVDGTSASARAAWLALKDNSNCVVLSGTAADPAAIEMVKMLRQEQIGHALKSLGLMGVREIGAVYASGREHALYREDLERIAADLKLGLQSFREDGRRAQHAGHRHASGADGRCQPSRRAGLPRNAVAPVRRAAHAVEPGGFHRGALHL